MKEVLSRLQNECYTGNIAVIGRLVQSGTPRLTMVEQTLKFFQIHSIVFA